MPDPCPICGHGPYVEQVEPWPAGHGPAPWAVGCYRTVPIEHFVGVNGDTKTEALVAWSNEAAKVKRMAESVRPALTVLE